ncbi:MAG: phage holin family protein [Candidatus Peribacteraceae bacterium]
MSIPFLIVLKFLANSILMYALHTYMPTYVTIFGGMAAYVIIGALLTLMNLFVRPILKIATAPARFIFGLPFVVLLNAGFFWLTYQIVLRMDPTLVVLAVSGGWWEWVVVSVIVGLVNWGMKKL